MILDDDEPLAVPRHWKTRPTSQPAVLYVENNVLLSRLVSDLLDLAGWHVRRAESGTIAQMFLRHEQRFALLLVDTNCLTRRGWSWSNTRAHWRTARLCRSFCFR